MGSIPINVKRKRSCDASQLIDCFISAKSSEGCGALNFSRIAATEKNKPYHTQVDRCKARYKTETSKAISCNMLIGFRKQWLGKQKYFVVQNKPTKTFQH